VERSCEESSFASFLVTFVLQVCAVRLPVGTGRTMVTVVSNATVSAEDPSFAAADQQTVVMWTTSVANSLFLSLST
jgi:hypothetical protein